MGTEWFLMVDGQPGPAYDKLPFKPVITNEAIEYFAERDGWVLRCRWNYVQNGNEGQQTARK
jgi:hypothetical protein